MAVLPCVTDCVVGLTDRVKPGGALDVTVALAVPITLPLAAVTVNGPPGVVAENNPLALIVPPPLTAQVNVG